MKNPTRPIDPKFAVLAAGIVVVIVYGSLYPFHFQNHQGSDGPLRNLIGTWRMPPGRGDFLANVLLYFPLGLLLVPLLHRLPALPRVPLAVFGGLTLSVIIELTQYYVPGRTSALTDVYANTLGSLLGTTVGTRLFGKPRTLQIAKPDRPFVILLLSCWLGYRLFPFAPTIDLHKYWTAVKPLIFSPSLPPLDIYRHMIAWLAVALLLEAILGTVRSRIAIVLLISVVLLARIFILDTVLSPAEVGGAVLALLAWNAFLSRLRVRAKIVAALFVGAVVIQALEPFHFNRATHPFEWIPFFGFMQGSLEVNIRSFLEKAFTYGALVWLMARAGSNLAVAAGLSSGLVLCLRLGQMFLPGRSAEITDAIMVLIFAAAIKLMGEDPRRRSGVPQAETPPRHSLLLGWYQSLTLNDPVQPADLIFVVAGRMERKHYGLELYRAGWAPRLVLSVGRFEVSKIGNLDSAVGNALIALRERIPSEERHFFVEMNTLGRHIEKVRLPRWSTYGEALALRGFLETTEIRKVMVVGTEVHLRRVALTYARVFRGIPVEFSYCAVPARFGFPAESGWWTRTEDRRYVLQETWKLAGYHLILSGPGWVTPWLMRLRD